MQIVESKIYSFRCPFVAGMEMTFSVPANSQQEAADILKDWFEKAQKELALLFPKVAPMPAEMQPDTLNALQIGLISDLITSLPGYEKIQGFIPLQKAVKELTDIELTLENFKVVVPILEKLKQNPQVIIGKQDGKKKA